MHPALQALVWVAALAVSAGGGWYATRLVLDLASRSADAGRDAPAAQATAGPLTLSDGPEGPGARRVLRGGTWIGLLERLGVTAAILAGMPEGAAIVVAVKGLGRYAELRDNPGASERFVIGTLASLVWASLVGFTGRMLLA
ncbi:hypothetical protein [Cellulomonas shaoxiangyii]|uniref:Uncharacterized protein n=1 Tax=Cellulomonas shaoxiangyii TaxID=2566013 RepID=A0A4P7SLF6_9CELL|nr:hypothetical protein [Cellulomonas shaoxiangyii]QCB93634.1 hypothetical protein E5225_08725 [Cellulomonas shaoxiangyii]TGY84621.1 hypothetical protein E5226_10455 [Cellulomonas shaoxiangyii]